VSDPRRVRRSSVPRDRDAGDRTPERPDVPRREAAPSTPEAVLYLQRAGGNAAVSALLNRTPKGAVAPARSVQRMWHLDWAGLTDAQKTERTAVHTSAPQKKWPSTTMAGLNAELSAGIQYAQANQGVAGPQPAWLNTQVMKQKKKQDGSPDGPPQPADLYKPGEKKKFAKIWGLVHNNTEGHLPGAAGTGGYREFYAEPAGGAAAYYVLDPAHPFGKNRAILQTNATNPYWWATDDHYNTINFVEDA
jgi:hypothetical protein